MRTQIFNTFKITALATALSFGISYVYAWTAPTVVPTGGNVLAPINTSGTAQTKAGGLNIATGSGNNVGIGATTPIRKLHLSDTNVVEMVMGATDGLANSRLWNFVVDGPAGTAKNFYIRQLNDAGTGGSIPLFIRGSDANVGIGTTAPGQKLTVAGAIGATGDICTTTTGPSVCLGSAGGTSVMTGNTNVMVLPAATANYTVMISGTYSTCDNFARNLLLDGVVVKTFADVGGDQAGCDQDTIQAKLTNVAAGTHTWSLSGGSNKDYLWTAYTNGAVLSTITDNGLGYGQTWQDVTASRASGVSYTNSTGKPIEISVTAFTSTGPLSLYLYVDGVKRWGMYSGNYVGNQAATIVVPSGSTYSATVSPSILSWHELR